MVGEIKSVDDGSLEEYYVSSRPAPGVEDLRQEVLTIDPEHRCETSL
jgi:hypothetical protein